MQGKKPAHVARGRTAAFIMLVSAGLASLTWSACAPAPTDLTELAEGSVAAETWQPKTAGAFQHPDPEGDGEDTLDGSEGGAPDDDGAWYDHDPSTDDEDDPVSPALLAVSTYTLDFGSSETYLAFTLGNADCEPLEYTVTAAANWLEVLSPEGVLQGQEDTVVWAQVRRCCSDWDEGLNHAELIIEGGNGEVHVIAVTVEVPGSPSRDQIALWLESLPPLPKVHYSYPANAWRLGVADQHAAAYHWVRITRSLALTARWVSEAPLREAVALCQLVNDENPGVNATLVLNYSPYHYVFPAGMPPTYDGPEYLEELELCHERMTLVKSWLDQANADFDATVSVSSLLLDCELPGWNTHEQGEPDAPEWQAALKEKYDAIYLICKDVFPDTYVDWFNRGKPCCKRRFTTDELGDSYSRDAYWTNNPLRLREEFRETHDQAQTDGVDRLLAWLALGAGWIERPGDGLPNTWVCDLEYDASYSWQLGAEVNDPGSCHDPDSAAMWDAVDAVAFYPGPGDVRTPRFFRHFADYVRGAHGLPPLE